MTDSHHSWEELENENDNNQEFWRKEELTENQLAQLQKWQVEEAKRIADLRLSKHFVHEGGHLICNTQYNNTIPVIDGQTLSKLININMDDDAKNIRRSLEKTLYEIFFDGSGCFILRKGYTPSQMEEFNI